MADEPDRESQTQEPTPRRLERARQDGDVVKSPEVVSFAALAAATAVVLTMGGSLAQGVTQALTGFIAHPDVIDLSASATPGVMRLALRAAAPVGVIMLAAGLGGAAGNLLQHGFLFTPKRLAPDFKRVSPAAGFKRLFGWNGLAHFLKTLVRFFALGLTLWLLIRPKTGLLQGMAALDPAAILPLTAELMRGALIATLVLSAVSAGVDWVLQRQQFISRLRMSREQVKEETRESEGDPHVKAKLKQMRALRAKRRVMQNVPKATLVVTNPTHYAVALRYVAGETDAPLCVAKGADQIALKIREVATHHGVPIVEDPPLARALYASVDLDEAIPREHYQAVAKIVGFVMGAANRRARSPHAGPRPATL